MIKRNKIHFHVLRKRHCLNTGLVRTGYILTGGDSSILSLEVHILLGELSAFFNKPNILGQVFSCIAVYLECFLFKSTTTFLFRHLFFFYISGCLRKLFLWPFSKSYLVESCFLYNCIGLFCFDYGMYCFGTVFYHRYIEIK